MGIGENLLCVRENIKKAADACGRDPSGIKLVAVSKFKSVEDIKCAVEYGVRDFGENYIQEFADKYTAIGADDVLWHIIGHVQKNKVKYIADKNVMVQTVDDISLAKELGKYAGRFGKVIPILIQVNTCGEETKSGCDPKELFHLFEDCLNVENISVEGLMTIGPNTDDFYDIEKCFEETYGLFERMKQYEKIPGQIKYLSMGMTNDYHLAIKHGANIVRVGRAIFGER